MARLRNYDPAFITPQKGYTVAFDGCADNQVGSREIFYGAEDYTYRWEVAGQVRVASGLEGCRWQLDLPEGQYPVRLTITNAFGSTRPYETGIYVRDYLIVALGDSFTSGEGNPDRCGEGLTYSSNYTVAPTWADRVCHRSLKSGVALAARELEASDPHSSVTFVDLACSGATVALITHEKGFPRGSGLLGSYIGIEPDKKNPEDWRPEDYLPPQVNEAGRLIGARKPHAVVMTAGVNDMRFGDALEGCIKQNSIVDSLLSGLFNSSHVFGSCPPASELAKLHNDLGVSYDLLAKAITDKLNSPLSVHLVEYPDPTRMDDGSVANEILQDIQTDLQCKVDRNEQNFLLENLLYPLNRLGKAKAQQHGWDYVPLASEFSGPGYGHGYNAADTWFIDAPASRDCQGPVGDKQNTKGTIHPNAKGHAALKARVYTSLLASSPELAPDGTLLRAYNTDAVYLIVGGAKFWVPSWEWARVNWGLGESAVVEVPAPVLASFPLVPRDGTPLFETGTNLVYVVEQGVLLPVDLPLSTTRNRVPPGSLNDFNNLVWMLAAIR